MAEFIAVIRPEPDASRDVKWLSRYNVPALAVPVMYPRLEKVIWPKNTSFQAIVFTSRYAVMAIAKSYAISSMRTLQVYAVGRGTALAAQQAGFVRIKTGFGGGRGLVPLIVANSSPDGGALFWPSASEISFDMVANLKNFGFIVERLPVYSMLSTSCFSNSFSKRIKKSLSAAVIAMSPRSIELFSKMLLSHELDGFRHAIKVIAGSQIIAEAAGSGWNDVFVAKSPRRSRLLAIATLLHRRSVLCHFDK